MNRESQCSRGVLCGDDADFLMPVSGPVHGAFLSPWEEAVKEIERVPRVPRRHEEAADYAAAFRWGRTRQGSEIRSSTGHRPGIGTGDFRVLEEALAGSSMWRRIPHEKYSSTRSDPGKDRDRVRRRSPGSRDQLSRSKRSSCMTLVQAATKSSTNFFSPSSLA